MTYDSARGVSVLAGGYNGDDYALGDTWEWDGTTWTSWPAVISPPRMRHAMAFDEDRSASVLFGGGGIGTYPHESGQTLESNGVNWAVRDDTPGPRAGHTMTYDTGRGATILYGGSTPPGVDVMWEWNGTRWIPITGPLPNAVWMTGLAFDSKRHVAVLFGGTKIDDLALAETWEWDGVSWTQRDIPGPPARFGHAMVYDRTRSVVVLFGGRQGASTLLDDTWTYDGTVWKEQPSAGPSERYLHQMVYDNEQHVVLMFGGAKFPPPHYFGDLWAWDGAQWSLLPSIGPGARNEFSMSFDDTAGEVWLFGGHNELGNWRDLWRRGGGNWELQPRNTWVRRAGGVTAFHEALGYSLLFGGANSGYLSDSWGLSAGGVANDMNADCVVDLGEFAALQNCVGAPETSLGCEPPDLDKDGMVSAADFSLLLPTFSGPAGFAGP